MGDHTIRAAQPDHVPAIRWVGEAAWRAAYGEFLPEAVIESAMSEWYDPESLRESIADDDVEFLVAEDEGSVVGYLSGRPDEKPDLATLGGLNVHPDHWNQGAGSALLAAFEACCRDRGRETIRIRVLAENDIGQSFYRTHGYESIEEREVDLFGETVTERVFEGSP